MKIFFIVSKVDFINGDKYVNEIEKGSIGVFLSKESAKKWIEKNGDKNALYKIDKVYHNVPE